MAMSVLKAVANMVSKVGGKLGGKVSAGSLINAGMGVRSAYSDYSTAREEGNGVVYSLGSVAAERALPRLMGPWTYYGYRAVTELPALVVNAAESYDQYGRSLAQQSNQRPFQNAQFTETQQSYTMRQAGMILAQKSKYSLQQTMLGNEAKYMHR